MTAAAQASSAEHISRRAEIAGPARVAAAAGEEEVVPKEIPEISDKAVIRVSPRVAVMAAVMVVVAMVEAADTIASKRITRTMLKKKIPNSIRIFPR